MISVVIPVGPNHLELVTRAIASVRAQTIPATVITIEDRERRGPGWARNQGLAQVVTPFVLFLDADDWLEPVALERLLDCIRRYPAQYAYSDCYAGDQYMAAPDTGGAWCHGKWHAISALLPTAWIREVGGFDEHLPGGEDTELFWKLGARRYCGVRVPEALLHYSADGERGRTFVQGPHYQSVMESIVSKHGGKMACCGQGAVAAPNGKEKQDGDVLAVALWGGNRRITGVMSARIYPRTGNGKLLWVDPRDIQAMPDLLRRASVLDEAEALAPLDGIDAIANAAMRGSHGAGRYQPPVKTRQALDIEQIIRMGTEGRE